VLLPIALLVFVTAFCIFLAIYFALVDRRSSPKAELKRRLQRMARSGANELPDDLRAEITREISPSDRFFANLRATRNLDRKLDHAGLEMTVTSFVAITSALAAVCGSAVLLRTHTLILSSISAVATIVAAEVFLKFKKQKRTDRFTQLFPEALTMISRSLRAGHSFTASIQLVGQEIPSPVGELFKTAYDQQLLGLRITDALGNLNERIDSLDLKFFTTVVSINADTGGNLSEILDKLSITIRERLRIRRQVSVYTAQGRVSGYVLGALPVTAFVAFNILNPEYESALLKDPLGIYILAFAACMQLIGMLVIRNIIKIRI
jgi:tight adherence protein B